MITRAHLPFEGQFVQVPNAWARDEKLSRRARGLLMELMSHRVGWKVTIAGLVAAGPEGRDAISGAVNELIDRGYLRRSQAQGQRGRFLEVEYELADPTGIGFTVSGSAVDGPAADGESAPKEDHVSEHQEKKTRARGTRVPDDFAVDDEMRAWAAAEVPSVDVVFATAQFLDYWRSVSGRAGVKLDWVATWRNSLRRDHRFALERGWKPAPLASVRDVNADLQARQKAEWCASHGLSVAQWDAMSADAQLEFAARVERVAS